MSPAAFTTSRSSGDTVGVANGQTVDERTMLI
jgi:hypothetical protein